MAELIMTEESSTPSTPSSGKWKIYPKADGYYVLDDAGLEIGPLGPLSDYIITPSVASNNLTLAIKNLAGADPSSSKPLLFRVGNTVYQLAAATSFTKNAATNWCNAGGTEMAAQPIDFFVYAIGETGASAGLKFGFSRTPYARTMGDFVNATTNEKYIAGNWTNFNSTDSVANIGRFRAQLSASASFNWSIASAAVVNRPIYETDWLSWNPVWSTTSGTFTSVTVAYARYKIRNNTLEFAFRGVGTLGGTASIDVQGTLPFEAVHSANAYVTGSCLWADTVAGTGGFGGTYIVAGTPDKCGFRKYNNANWSTSGSGTVVGIGFCEI